MVTRLTRRYVIPLIGATSALALLPVAVKAETTRVARLIVLADLHSAYDRLGPLLAAIEREIGNNSASHAILINGDVFEGGNVVTARSGGRVDWAFLSALRKHVPVVLNIGNHEPDLENDLAAFIATAREAGIAVVSNIRDARTGEPYADARTILGMGGVRLSIVGIATNALNTYPKATQPHLDIPDPVAWAAENIPGLVAEGTLPVILSHAGVVADRDILKGLPDGTLLVGGHDHLRLTHAAGQTRYFHTGSWAAFYTVVEIAADRSLTVTQQAVDASGLSSFDLGPLIRTTLAEYLTGDERAEIGFSIAPTSLDDTGRRVAATMAAAVGADAGFIGHTTFGTGLPAGAVSRYAFDAIVRFDGKFMVADIDAADFAAIVARCNQDGDIPLAARTGDYLYAAPPVSPGKATVRIVTNDWSAMNQMKYFGREGIAFAEVPGLRLKDVIAASLR